MPSKTLKQHKAMCAAASGKGTSGIPAHVGAEFCKEGVKMADGGTVQDARRRRLSKSTREYTPPKSPGYKDARRARIRANERKAPKKSLPRLKIKPNGSTNRGDRTATAGSAAPTIATSSRALPVRGASNPNVSTTGMARSSPKPRSRNKFFT